MAKEIIKDDLVEAFDGGVNQGWLHGYLTAKLGINWPELWANKDARKRVIAIENEARRRKENYNMVLGSAAIMELSYLRYLAVTERERK